MSTDEVIEPTVNKQVLRSQRSSKALLEAAIDIIVEGGVSSLTLATVGERAGYSRGLATARFGSKEGLIEALIRRIVGQWSHRNVLPLTTSKSGLDGVDVLCRAILVQFERGSRGLRALYALMFEALNRDDETLRIRFADFQDGMRGDLVEMINRGKRDGSIKKSVDATAEAGLLVAGLRGVAYQWLLDPERFDPMPVLEHMVRSTVERLKT